MDMVPSQFHPPAGLTTSVAEIVLVPQDMIEHKETIMHGHDRHNTTILSVIHDISITCFGQYYFWPSC